MKRILLTLAMISAAATSALAKDDMVIEIDPGLYHFNSSMYTNGQLTFTEDPYDYCLTEDMATTSLDEILGKLMDGGACNYTNIVRTTNQASADFSCPNNDFGVTVTGTLEGQYTPSSYEINGLIRAPFGIVTAKSTASRRGECPVGWVNPSHINP